MASLFDNIDPALLGLNNVSQVFAPRYTGSAEKSSPFELPPDLTPPDYASSQSAGALSGLFGNTPPQSSQSSNSGALSYLAPFMGTQAQPDNPGHGYSQNVVNNADIATNLLKQYQAGLSSPENINNLRSQAQQALGMGAETLATPGTVNGLNAPQYTALAALIGGNPMEGVEGWATPKNQFQQSLLMQGAAANQQNELQKQKANAMLNYLAPQSTLQEVQNQQAYNAALPVGAQGTVFGADILGNQGAQQKNNYVMQGFLAPEEIVQNRQAENKVLNDYNIYKTNYAPELVNPRINSVTNQLSKMPDQYKLNSQDSAALGKAGIDLTGNITPDILTRMQQVLPVNSAARIAATAANRLMDLPGGAQVAQQALNSMATGAGFNSKDVLAQVNGLKNQMDQQRFILSQQANTISRAPTTNRGRLNLSQIAADAGDTQVKNQHWKDYQDFVRSKGVNISPAQSRKEFEDAYQQHIQGSE